MSTGYVVLSFVVDIILITCLILVNDWVHLEGLQDTVQKTPSEFLGWQLGLTMGASPLSLSLSAKI